MRKSEVKSGIQTLRIMSIAAAATVLLSACATQKAERPVVEMTRAETSIQEARQSGARLQAPTELQSAQRHFSSAQDAIEAEEFLEARRLAERAEVDAQLAESKARSAEAYETVAELQEGIRVLQEELERAANTAR